uniref:Uncharacterized protein n=1 Tax=Physcomitrium patens TaxID=3218 RepID=A0A7I4B6T5_PHYPA
MRNTTEIAERKHGWQPMVLVRHVPKDESKPTGKKIQEFFQEIYPDHYCTH